MKNTGTNKHRRKKGGGTLQLRYGVWQARWTVDGRVFTRSTKTAVKKDAERLLADWTADFRDKNELRTIRNLQARAAAVQDAIDDRRRVAIDDAFILYRASPERPAGASEATLATYEGQYRQFARWIDANAPGVKDLRGVSREVAAAYAAYLRERAGANAFNKRITLFRAIWKCLADAAGLKENPWERIRKLPVESFSRRELSAAELQAVFACAEGEMRTLFALGMYTGLRLGDCALLDWKDVDLNAGVIRITPHKTARTSGRAAAIPVHPVLGGLLRATPPERRRGAVMPQTAKAYGRDSGGFSRRVQEVFRRAGIETQSGESASGRARVEVGFHSLRHTFVSMAANAGTPLAVVQAIVGHSSRAMTMHYFHENREAVRRAVDALPDVSGGAARPAETGAAEAAMRALDGLDRAELAALRDEIARRLGATNDR